MGWFCLLLRVPFPSDPQTFFLSTSRDDQYRSYFGDSVLSFRDYESPSKRGRALAFDINPVTLVPSLPPNPLDGTVHFAAFIA